MPEIQPGQTVRIKSGGPVMTVELHTINGVKCGWFVDGEYKSADIGAAALEAAEPEKPSGARVLRPRNPVQPRYG